MLNNMKPENINFLNTFLEKRKALPVYNSLTNTISGNITSKSNDACAITKRNIYCINDFPSYINGSITDNIWKSKKVNTYKGSLILLKEYNNTKDYLKKKFKTPKRFRIYQSKLENSFNIEYKSYYGDISKKEYDFLFEEFHKMLKTRFLEKQIKNHDLSRWEAYHEAAFPLIKNKEAVFFVIFSDRKPISFYLNLLHNKTVYGYVKTYDIDYSKFSIGFINFIQQLKWCFENNIEVYDLLKGNYAYKNKLIDQEFYYQKHIIYNSKSLLSIIYANFIFAKTRLFYGAINVLKMINVDLLYHKLTNNLYNNKIGNDAPKIIIANLSKKPNEQLDRIDLNDETFSFLKRITYKFLYHNDESMETVELFKFNKEVNTYLISGKKQLQKITFQ